MNLLIMLDRGRQVLHPRTDSIAPLPAFSAASLPVYTRSLKTLFPYFLPAVINPDQRKKTMLVFYMLVRKL